MILYALNNNCHKAYQLLKTSKQVNINLYILIKVCIGGDIKCHFDTW